MVCFSIFLVINIIKLKGKGDEQAILFKAKQLNRIWSSRWGARGTSQLSFFWLGGMWPWSHIVLIRLGGHDLMSSLFDWVAGGHELICLCGRWPWPQGHSHCLYLTVWQMAMISLCPYLTVWQIAMISHCTYLCDRWPWSHIVLIWLCDRWPWSHIVFICVTDGHDLTLSLSDCVTDGHDLTIIVFIWLWQMAMISSHWTLSGFVGKYRWSARSLRSLPSPFGKTLLMAVRLVMNRFALY